MNGITNMVVEYFSGTLGKVELIATILLILNVYLLAKQKIINFAFGIVGVIMFGWLFMKYQLYNDMALQWAYFLPIQIFNAWYWWNYGPNKGTNVAVTSLTWTMTIISAIVIVGYAFGSGYYMANYTDASFPYWDALTTGMSVVAQYLMIKKYWESWVLWIMMDILQIPIYFAKELYVTSGLYVVFLGLATFGLIEWYKSWDKVRRG